MLFHPDPHVHVCRGCPLFSLAVIDRIPVMFVAPLRAQPPDLPAVRIHGGQLFRRMRHDYSSIFQRLIHGILDCRDGIQVDVEHNAHCSRFRAPRPEPPRHQDKSQDLYSLIMRRCLQKISSFREKLNPSIATVPTCVVMSNRLKNDSTHISTAH